MRMWQIDCLEMMVVLLWLCSSLRHLQLLKLTFPLWCFFLSAIGLQLVSIGKIPLLSSSGVSNSEPFSALTTQPCPLFFIFYLLTLITYSIAYTTLALDAFSVRVSFFRAFATEEICFENIISFFPFYHICLCKHLLRRHLYTYFWPHRRPTSYPLIAYNWMH